jgi:hypothetical protein
MYGKLKKMKFFILSGLLYVITIPASASTNIALNQFLNEIRGSSFNVLIAPPHIVKDPQYKLTLKAINNGYKKEIRNMRILMRKLSLPSKLRAPGMINDLPQYFDKDKKTGANLKRLIEEQTSLWENRLSEEIVSASDRNKNTEKAEEGINLGDDIGADLDFDTDLIETTDDTYEIDNTVISPGKIANDIFLDIGDIYAQLFVGQEVHRMIEGNMEKIILKGRINGLHEIYLPFPDDQGKPVAKPLHAVYGSAFLPDKKGAIHVLRMYVFVIVNDPEIDKVRVAARPIPRFIWDRNEYYVSAATGSVLRAIFSEALGVKIEAR